MQAKLSMALGGALMAQSLEFLQDSAAGVITEQIKLLQDSKAQSCDKIIATLVTDIDRHNNNLASEHSLTAFIEAVMKYLE